MVHALHSRCSLAKRKQYHENWVFRIGDEEECEWGHSKYLIKGSMFILHWLEFANTMTLHEVISVRLECLFFVN
jgi:hypothetical protein